MTLEGRPLLFGFDAVEGAAPSHVLGPEGVERPVPRFRNLDAKACMAPLLTQYLIANRRRLRLEVHLTRTERAAASDRPWLYELAIHNLHAEATYFTAPGGFWPMLPEVVREALRDGRARLLISNLVEGSVLPPLERLYPYLEGIGIEPGRVGYVCAATNAARLHESLCEALGIDERVHVCGLPFWEEQTLADFLLQQGAYRLGDGPAMPLARFATEAFASRQRSAPFLCLNGKGRHHRWALCGLLAARGLLERGVVSFLARDFEDAEWWPREPLGSEARAGVALLRGRVPLVADAAMRDPHEGSCFSSHLYLRTALSLVAETLFAGEPAHLCSEKALRPILHLHPVLLVGPPGLLGSLRRAGYETFRPWLNEDYDEMEDPTDRLGAVAGEVTRIARMDADELRRWYQGLFDRLEHNLCRLLSQRHHVPDEQDAELTTCLLGLYEGADARGSERRAGHDGGPSSQEPAPGSVEPVRLPRMRVADLLPNWEPTCLVPAGDPRVASEIACRLWRWSPRTFARAELQPARALLTEQSLDLEFVASGAIVSVHVCPSELCTRAYRRTSRLAIFYSGKLPSKRSIRVLDRLALAMEGMDFRRVRELCLRSKALESTQPDAVPDTGASPARPSPRRDEP